MHTMCVSRTSKLDTATGVKTHARGAALPGRTGARVCVCVTICLARASNAVQRKLSA